MEVGEREIIYLSLHCHHHCDVCIKVGSDESHLNDKGEPKQIRTEVPPLTSLTPYH